MFIVPRKFNQNKLPTKSDVIEHLLFLRGKNRSIALSKFYTETIKEILKLWESAQIPTIGKSAIRKKLDNLTKSYRTVIKNKGNFNVDEWNTLFPICTCKCGLNLNKSCKCLANLKMPLHDWEINNDQDGRRMRSLGLRSNIRPSSISSTSEVADIDEEYTVEMSPDSPTSFGDVTENAQTPLHISRISLPTFSHALDRAGVSNRFGALLATTLLKDLNISDVIIDKNKIRRERLAARAKAICDIKCNDLLKCISFDGKREKSLKQIVVDNKPRNIKVTEEHITIVQEPNSRYIGYFTPFNCTGTGIASGILNFLKAEGISWEHLVAVNCDGTSTNTGKHSGAICSLEKELQHPLQWFICLFHFNELPFTALLKELVGKPTGS